MIEEQNRNIENQREILQNRRKRLELTASTSFWIFLGEVHCNCI